MTTEKLAWVVGASSGIGLATARRLHGEGWGVVGLGRRMGSLRSAGIEEANLDLSDLDRLPEQLSELMASWPLPDAAVLAAGVGMLGGLEEASWQQIRAVIDLDLTAQIFLARALVPAMKRRGHGDLVLLGSESALKGGRRGSVYCAAKFGLRGFAQALRQECAGAGIRVSIVHPGVVRTPFFDDLEIEPGPEPEHALEPEDVATVIADFLKLPPTAVVDEIVVSPRQQQIRRRGRR